FKDDPELAARLPGLEETIPAVEEILLKKAENRPVTPEEFAQLTQFVDRVERGAVQIKEEAARVEDEQAAAVRAEIPAGAFNVRLDDSGIKNHVVVILTEAGYETVGDLMVALKTDANKVLGLAGVGPKAMQNIEESLAALAFPEPEKPVEAETQPEVEKEAEAAAEAAPAAELVQPVEAVVEAKEVEEPPAMKDGVSLEEMFAFKPETFTTAGAEEESEGDKKKGKKKGKKKSVELEYDETLGEVVSRKKHKRGDGAWEEE
ncbi:MAG: hypothetical protein KJZ57_05885, partial [Anaerolineales bacterium]|nr:hypothetical protein [Anaerolineales bacterium]